MCSTKKKVIRLSAILLSMIILITAIPTIPFASAASSSAEVNVGQELKSIIKKDGFIPGQRSNCSCKEFADAVSKKLFGTKIGSLTNTPYVLNTADYNCVATVKNTSKSKLVNLLKKAKPGDVIQYKSGYTNPFHTAVIFSVSDNGMKVLNTRTIGGKYYVKLDSMSWSNITSSWPGIGSISGYGRGLSLYHSKKYNALYEDKATATLNKNSVTLGVGETYTLKGTVDCNAKNCTTKFSTSSSSVVSVSSSGKLTAKKSGTATITYSCSNGAKATCKVTVKSAPKSVSLNKTSITLKVGQPFDLNSKVNTGTASLKRTYTTTDSSVATVKNTIITAKKAGTATITVKTFNGKTATCKVTVKK